MQVNINIMMHNNIVSELFMEIIVNNFFIKLEILFQKDVFRLESSYENYYSKS